MDHEWPCAICLLREGGLCGALMGNLSKESRMRERPGWQDYQGARANQSVVIRGDICEYVYILCDGWAFRFFQLADGHRQILHFLLPGDLFSVSTVYEERYHFSVQALTAVRLSRFKRAEIQARLAGNFAISQALAKSSIIEIDDADELLTALGQRSADERIAYLLLHLMKRIAAHRVIREQRYPFPLRQQHIAEIAGLTPVHVNRVIATFRDRGLIELSGGYLTVLDLAELERLGCLR